MHTRTRAYTYTYTYTYTHTHTHTHVISLSYAFAALICWRVHHKHIRVVAVVDRRLQEETQGENRGNRSLPGQVQDPEQERGTSGT
jgi:hypothetical protein